MIYAVDYYVYHTFTVSNLGLIMIANILMFVNFDYCFIAGTTISNAALVNSHIPWNGFLALFEFLPEAASFIS